MSGVSLLLRGIAPARTRYVQQRAGPQQESYKQTNTSPLSRRDGEHQVAAPGVGLSRPCRKPTPPSGSSAGRGARSAAGRGGGRLASPAAPRRPLPAPLSFDGGQSLLFLSFPFLSGSTQHDMTGPRHSPPQRRRAPPLPAPAPPAARRPVPQETPPSRPGPGEAEPRRSCSRRSRCCRSSRRPCRGHGGVSPPQR